ncbi:Cytochrome c oxidase assembly protein cox16 [Penicillium cataractarum]|uniref:Cytochrome c oxidase assembly protein COX16, mitochondrial n=1 Tax=Penicillium cataractarum TaxID=2100454 RepID=A0A9X0B5W3_9EURO|nr:Cytochrome c oxidase assembly protein cox16 [Penicillium cataractarum]KAJ5389329.1 Cytochrome c oxidase assembly protein cox16 [Penicillium cataractarum]
MPTFQSKTFRRATTASSSFGERLGAFYRARLTRHPFLLFGLPFMAVIVAGSFALTPAAALRYERYDRKVQQVSKEEAFELGLKGPDGEEGIKRNPRRRIIGDEREEYYVRAPMTRVRSIAQRLDGMLIAFTETYGEGLGQLGTETSEAIRWRARRKDMR